MLYLLHGEDTFTARDELRRIRAAALPADDVFNYATVDGSRGGKADDLLDTLITACEGVPFMADRRVVVVQGIVTRLGKGAAAREGGKGGGVRERLAAYLDSRLPDSTDLILYEAPVKIAVTDIILKVVAKRGKVLECVPPTGMMLEKWLVARARALNYVLEPDAAALLANIAGTGQADLHRMANELDKLAAYAGEGQPITRAAVELLTPETREAVNFGLSNAIAERNLPEALLQMRLMAEESDMPAREFHNKILQLLAGQIQTLIKVKALKDAGRYSKDEMAARLKIHPYVVQKSLPLVQRFSADHLTHLYHDLSDLDYRNKTGRVDLGPALDLFLHDACKTPAPRA